MSNDQIKSVILAADKGKRYPVMEVVRTQTELGSLISKLVASPGNVSRDEKGDRTFQRPDALALRSISDSIAMRNNDNLVTMQMLPDVKLSMTIMVSLICAPKDMVTVELTYSSDTSGLIPANITAMMTKESSEYYERVHKIKSRLPEILEDALFMKGSYPILIIPENSIDDAINNFGTASFESLSPESFSDHIDIAKGELLPLGLLGTKPTTPGHGGFLNLGLESFSRFDLAKRPDPADTRIQFSKLGLSGESLDGLVSVTDNYSAVKISKIRDTLRAQNVSRILTEANKGKGRGINAASLESAVRKLGDREIEELIYKDRSFRNTPITSLKTNQQLGRTSIGNPLLMFPSNAAVIPVYVPGDMTRQVGVFIALDEEGNPISGKARNQQYADMANYFNAGGNFASAMMNKSKSAFAGYDCNNNQHLDYSNRIFGDMVEKDLLERLKHGVYGNGVALARNEDVYMLMLARTLKGSRTQMLWVPNELMVYIAFDHNADGIGKSLLDDMRNINSMRIQLMVAGLNASIKNSIGRTRVDVTIDEHNPDAQKSIEEIMDGILTTRNNPLPMGINNMAEITTYFQRAGYEWSFTGHPGIPDTKIEFSEVATDYTTPNQELVDELRKHSINSTGVTVDQVDAGFEAEFAQSLLNSNVLMTKRVMMYQEKFTPQLDQLHRKIGVNSEELMGTLRDIVRNNFASFNADRIRDLMNLDKAVDLKPYEAVLVEHIVHEFISNLSVSLPSPNTVTLTNQLAAFNTFKDLLDVGLDAWVNSAYFSSNVNGEKLNGEVDAFKDMISAYFIRQWFTTNGVMPELAALTTLDETGKPGVDLTQDLKSHIEALGFSAGELFASLVPYVKAVNKKLKAIGETNYESDDSNSGGSDGSSDGGGFNDNFGEMPNDNEPELPDDNDQATPPSDDPDAVDPPPDDLSPEDDETKT